jgi:NhaA family Na+:H+ antiporter
VNAGVSLSGVSISDLLAPLPLGIAAGLFIGKQIGIFGASYVLIKSKLVSMPENASWMQLYAVSVIAGIGFTMSLFIGSLAFQDPALQEMVKIGVIAGSLLCVLWGAVVLRMIR